MHLIDGKASPRMIAAEATLLASGTVALGRCYCKSPMVVGYRMKPFTYFGKTIKLKQNIFHYLIY